MVGEDEIVMPVGRGFALPAALGTGLVVGVPGSADRPEKVRSPDDQADARVTGPQPRTYCPGTPSCFANALAPRDGGEGPPVQLHPTHSERLTDALVDACAVAVDRDAEIVNPAPCHGCLAFFRVPEGCHRDGAGAL